MGKLILYSLAAHLIILGFIFTVPLVYKERAKPREIYRVSFVELSGGPPAPRVRAPVPKKLSPEKKKRAKEKVSGKKKEVPKARPEAKKETPKPERKALEKPSAQPAVKKLPAPKEAEKPKKTERKTAQAPEKTEIKETVRKKKRSQGPPEGAEEQASQGAGKATASTASLGPKTVGRVSLENIDFPYSYYLAVMQRKIGERWQPIYGEIEKGGAGRVVVFFRVLRDGTIKDLKVEKSSGSEFLDGSALRAIAEAGPMPPLPFEFQGDELRVHFGFEYSGEG
jgi:TonB family protein